MKLFIILMLISNAAYSQVYGSHYGYQYGSYYSMPSYEIDNTDAVLEKQRNVQRNMIRQGMQELEIRSNIRRNEMINGGRGDGNYNYRY